MDITERLRTGVNGVEAPEETIVPRHSIMGSWRGEGVGLGRYSLEAVDPVTHVVALLVVGGGTAD